MKTKLKAMAAKEAKQKTSGQKLFKKDGALSSNAKGAIKTSTIRGNRIYPIYWSGRARNIREVNHTSYIKRFLALAGFKYKSGNDAPRGGKVGNYLQVSAPALKLLKSV